MSCTSTVTALFELRAGDLLPVLDIQLTRVGSIDPVDLTAAASVTLTMTHTDGTEVVVTGSFVSRPLGKVRFTWVAGDTNKKGLYAGLVVCLFPGDKPMSFPSDGTTLPIRIH